MAKTDVGTAIVEPNSTTDRAPSRCESSVVPEPRAVGRVRRRLQAIARVTRAIIGAPDYERYVAHNMPAHPGKCLLTRAEFEQSRLQDRYARPGSRCC
jgi:uncharacterized short protein YbdD (DUF466 family)